VIRTEQTRPNLSAKRKYYVLSIEMMLEIKFNLVDKRL